MLSSSLNQQGATPFKKEGYIQAPTYNPNTVAQAKPLSVASLPQSQTGTVKKQVVKTAGGDTHEIHYDTQSTPSGGTVQNINGGQVYSNPLDNPNFKPSSGVLNTTTSTPPKSVPTASTSPATVSSTSNAPTYGGLIGQAAVASKIAADIGAENYKNYSGKAEEAYKTAADTNQIITRSKSDVMHNPNYSLDTGIGRAGLIEQNYGQQGANANAVAAGYGNLANSAISTQGQGISGLAGAASGIRPESNFPFVFDPGTATFNTPGVNGSGGTPSGFQLTYNPQQDAQTLAQQVINHRIAYNDAVTALGYGGKNSIAEGQLSQAVIGAGGNPTILKSQAQSQGDNTTKYTEGKLKLDAANTIANQIADTFASDKNLNKSDLSLWTNFNQIYSGALGTPNQQKLTQQINNYISTLGLDPSTVIPIAYQKKQTVGELLSSLADTYKAKNDVYKNGGSFGGGSNDPLGIR